jgi:hypothetical protein
MIALTDLSPAAEEGWRTLFELMKQNGEDWVLVGGQMMVLLAVEHGARLLRATDDIDVVVDVRSRPKGTEWLTDWLIVQGFELDGASPDLIGHRFVRDVAAGRGKVVFDVLAPEGLGARTRTFTRRPIRTVQAPGATQAIERAEIVDVSVQRIAGDQVHEGHVRRPTLLGALVAKAAAATEIAVRTNPERDWQDAALLASLIADPVATASQCNGKDRQRLRRLLPLEDRNHRAWAPLGDDEHRRGAAALRILLDPPGA